MIGLVLAALVGAASASPSIADTSTWGIVCFCLHSQSTPQRVIHDQDNGRVLYEARNGATQRELQSRGLLASDAQLATLTRWSLLTRAGEVYRTSFPILAPEQMRRLRPRVRHLAARAVRQVLPDVARLRTLLTERGHRDSHYAIVFSYVLDGLVWDELEKRGRLPSSYPTAAHPNWNGALWAFSPTRPGVEGTNDVTVGDTSIRILWNDKTLEAERTIAPEADVKRLLGKLEMGPLTPPARTSTADTLLTDEAGRLSPVVIRTDGSDRVHRTGVEMARKIASLLQGREGRRLSRSVSRTAPDVGLLVVTHELMWDVISSLTKKGVVDRPVASAEAHVLDARALLPMFYVLAKPSRQ